MGRILLFTGDGKGKTTAALGMALRASGHGLRTLVVQFVKEDPKTGEVAGAAFLPGLEILQTGRGFVPPPEAPAFAGHRQAAVEGLRRVREAFAQGRHDLVVLDEICVAVAKGLLQEGDVIAALGQASPGTTVVLTGRDAPPGLLALADTVTDMRSVRHGLACGLRAQKGVEY